MKVSMLWHGGSSYGVGTIPEDLEEFDSLKQAIRVFDARYNEFDPYYPCVDNSSSAWVFFGTIEEVSANSNGDYYPDRVLSFGPRGGVKVEHA